ncbi:uncharacterized protein LOC112045123 [Bicyclus anynana]|uniref:Uncharacterized protein LOC112045123 n=1 Tax=Bicyclus anynana TaxID=110368 RepID=A0A6J1MVI8_BICAN|nr:uncharacterized protein LOC112045123 [Bicyclus anynana]
MPYNHYIPITKERYDILMDRYKVFQDTIHMDDVEPIKVFEPMTPKIIEEILLIREVSMELQKKKEEDMKKTQGVENNQVPEGTNQAEETKESNLNGAAEIPAEA